MILKRKLKKPLLKAKIRYYKSLYRNVILNNIYKKYCLKSELFNYWTSKAVLHNLSFEDLEAIKELNDKHTEIYNKVPDSYT